jgi:hypothetical protein
MHTAERLSGRLRRGEAGLRATTALLGRRERFCMGIAILRRLAKDYERLPATLAGLHFVAFACLFLQQATAILGVGS